MGIAGGKGFADLVLYNEGNVEIYEIKPISYYGTGEGDAQLERYVKAYDVEDGYVIKGSIENVELLLNWEDTYYYDPDLNIRYEMFEDSPSMIYYTFEYEDPERQKELAKQPIRYLEPDEDMEKWLLFMAGLSTGAGGAAIYAKRAGINIKEVFTSRVFPFFIVLPDEIKRTIIRYPYGEDCENIA